MKKEALDLFNNPDLILLGFILFFATFIGILIWVFRKSQSEHYKNMSTIPLEKHSTRKTS